MRIVLKRRAEVDAFEALEAAGGALPLPTGRHRAAERALIRRLEGKGALFIDGEAGTYQRSANVEVDVRKPLLERLREGPVRAAEWWRYADSRKSVHVQISRLRAEGHKILDERDPAAPSQGGPVIYRLA